ncbi:MAG: ImmA/IrrE family metallo-endopeptidase [Afipia sp.]|nr:ImmA/IrrE family metallo-endopeptidase [Afipia sp.]
MALPKQKIVARPSSEAKLSDISHKLIREAGAAGLLPTPIDRLIEIASITNVDSLPDDTFLQTLSEKARGFFVRAKQKLRGIADLRTKAIYTAPETNRGRKLFVKAHELGHQVIPWHNVDPAYLDDNESVGPKATGIFEHEANFFGAETIFQGKNFRNLARDYQPSAAAIFTLADKHSASNQATAWRFVEEQDEPVALLQYYPGKAIDDHGNYVLNIWCSVGSPEFNRRFSEIQVPHTVRTGHPWVAARDLNRDCDGNENLLVDGNGVAFQWIAWWNSYALFVMLRRKPMLRLVGGILRP